MFFMNCKRIARQGRSFFPFVIVFLKGSSFCYFILLDLRSFRQTFDMFKGLSLEFRNIPTQNCAPIQCTVYHLNGC